MNLYILEDKTPVLVTDSLLWSEWMEKNREAKRVAKTNLDHGRVTVSTVFLGIDHSFVENGLPILFETMIFGGPLNDYQERCSTWEEAEEMHARAVKKALDVYTVHSTKSHEL